MSVALFLSFNLLSSFPKKIVIFVAVLSQHTFYVRNQPTTYPVNADKTLITCGQKLHKFFGKKFSPKIDTSPSGPISCPHFIKTSPILKAMNKMARPNFYSTEKSQHVKLEKTLQIDASMLAIIESTPIQTQDMLFVTNDPTT
jgi:hypothetical protein